MRNSKKKILSLILSLAATGCIAMSTITASAATADEVREAAKDAGVSEFYINQGLKNDSDFTSKQYDDMLVYIKNYKDTVNKYLAKYFGGNADDYSTGDTSRKSDDEFVNMSLEEKQQKVQSMSEKDRDEFIKTMTNSERNSVIKQLSTSEKTKILNPLVEFANSLGYNISIDAITGSTIDMTVRDADGNIIDSSSIGSAIDDVGYSYTIPLLTVFISLTVSISGFTILNMALKKRGNANE